MDCTDVNKLIYLYKDGEISASEKKLLNKHLQSCGTCRALYRETEELRDFISELKKDPIPGLQHMSAASIAEKAMLTDVDKPDRSAVKIQIWRAISTAAAILLIALLVYQQYDIKQNINQLNVRIQQQTTNPAPDERSNQKLLMHLRKSKVLESADEPGKKEALEMLQLLKEQYPDLYEQLKADVQSEHVTL